jgi:glycosyltransferase involved in cell wall biosynthesis
MPSVSIIVNVRNGAATLREALDSALAQTHTDWELIVWDDRSSDESAQIVGSFRDPRILYILGAEDTSLGQARGMAIRRARGEWLAFLDQDDVWLPGKLEEQLALANSPEVGLIYGRTVCFYPDGRQRDYDQFHEFSPLPEGNILAELLGRGCFVAMSSALIRRTAVERIGGIPSDIHIIPDYFLYAAACRNYEARAVQEVVCRYRVHPASMTMSYRRESLQETLTLVENWRHRLQPAVFARRHASISTALALEELRQSKTASQGVQRLLATGSVLWLAGRPFVHIWRILRRRLQRPYWKGGAG